MTDTTIIKDHENEFIKDHVTDALYDNIVNELSDRKKGTKGSRQIRLTPEILRGFLFYVSMGVSFREAAESVHLSEKTRQDYNRRSKTFKEVASLAASNVSLRARLAVARSIMGTKPGYYQLIHPGTKQVEYIQIKGIEPNVQVAQWWLEKVDKIGGDDGSAGTPQLGAPRNEEEAKLLEMLLNKHYDYVKAKSSK